MNIDVSKIVQDKIDSLAQEGSIEKAIQETFEKTILKAVTDSLDSYNLKKTIEQKVTTEVNSVVAELDFHSYNSFMCEKMLQIVNQTCKEDLCEKMEKKFKDLFLCQLTEIKLSDIYKAFGKLACESVDESEKWDRCDEGWHYKLEESFHGWLDCELDYEDRHHRYRSDCAISFVVHKNFDDKSKGWISTVYLDGVDVNKTFTFKNLNGVEIMLIQAVMNRIPIIIDIDEDDVDNSWDIDY